MKIEGWEPRALPSESRCRRWGAQRGQLLVGSHSGAWVADCGERGVDYAALRHDVAGLDVRPWKDGEPAPWSEFDTATDPPVPEGWEAVGEWGTAVRGAPPDIEAFLHEDGGVYGRGEERPGGRVLWLRKIAPPVTWADVPDGVKYSIFEGVCLGLVVWYGKQRCGVIFPDQQAPTSAHDLHQEPIPGSPFPSQPAAVVAVLRHAGVMK